MKEKIEVIINLFQQIPRICQEMQIHLDGNLTPEELREKIKANITELNFITAQIFAKITELQIESEGLDDDDSSKYWAALVDIAEFVLPLLAKSIAPVVMTPLGVETNQALLTVLKVFAHFM